MKAKSGNYLKHKNIKLMLFKPNVAVISSIIIGPPKSVT
jgi:hypothetical protein